MTLKPITQKVTKANLQFRSLRVRCGRLFFWRVHLIAVDIVVRHETLDSSDGVERTLTGHLLQHFLVLFAVAEEEIDALCKSQFNFCKRTFLV